MSEELTEHQIADLDQAGQAGQILGNEAAAPGSQDPAELKWAREHARKLVDAMVTSQDRALRAGAALPESVPRNNPTTDVEDEDNGGHHDNN